MKRTVAAIIISIILFISGIFFVNKNYLNPFINESPKVKISTDNKNPKIRSKTTTYKKELISQPLVENSRVNQLINKEYSIITEQSKNVSYEILLDSDYYLSIIIYADNKIYPHTYDYSSGSEITLDSISLPDTIIKGLSEYTVKNHFGLTQDTIQVYEYDSNKQSKKIDEIKEQLTIDFLKKSSPSLANEIYQKREELKNKELLADRIATEKSKLNLKSNCYILKCIALTFDDGPSTPTEQVLTILKEKDVKATFYLLGLQVQKYPELTKKIVADGHSLGNHTYNHVDLSTKTDADVFEEINKTQNLIYDTTGRYPLTYRPPMGKSNKNIANFYPFDEVLWSVDTRDWEHRNTEKTITAATTNIQEDGIIIMHDIYRSTADALPEIIDKLKEQGFVFVTIEDLASPNQVYNPQKRTITTFKNTPY